MAGFSNYFANKIMNLAFGGAAYTFPATYYLAAMTAAPTDDGGGTEVSGGGYARVALASNTTVFPTTTTQEKNLGSTASFPEATSNWGSIVAIAIYDASSGGNLAGWTTITPQVINLGATLKVPAGTAGLKLTLD
jgi:hypothetical protein